MLEENLPELDLASALTLLGDAVSRTVLEALSGTGLRHGHGYLVQRLLVAPATATEIADELRISQQAVSKALKELAALGHVETVPGSVDRRRRPVQLTARGRDAVETARTARRGVDEQIRAVLGDEELERTLGALKAAMSALGMTDGVQRRAVRPPGPALD